MTRLTVQTIETRIPKFDDAAIARSRSLEARNDDLNAYGRHGYELAHTVAIDGAEYVTIVDTLTRVE